VSFPRGWVVLSAKRALLARTKCATPMTMGMVLVDTLRHPAAKCHLLSSISRTSLQLHAATPISTTMFHHTFHTEDTGQAMTTTASTGMATPTRLLWALWDRCLWDRWATDMDILLRILLCMVFQALLLLH